MDTKKIPHSKGFTVLGAAVLIMLACAGPAYAYLDPGAGSLILQGLIAGIVAVGVGVRIYWHRLLRLLGIRKDMDSDEK